MNKFEANMFNLHRMKYFSAFMVILNYMNEIEPPKQLAKELEFLLNSIRVCYPNWLQQYKVGSGKLKTPQKNGFIYYQIQLAS